MWMLGPQGVFIDRQRTLEERLGLGVVALGLVEQRQVVEARGHLGVLRPQGFLPDRQGALMERLGLGVLALGSVQRCQVVEARGQSLVFRSEPFRYLKSSTPEPFSVTIIPLLIRLHSSAIVLFPLLVSAQITRRQQG